MTGTDQGSSQFRKFILALDPGLANFRVAVHGTLSVVCAFFVVSVTAPLVGQPTTLAFLGVMIAMVSALAINDQNKRQQMGTFLLLPFPASLGMASSLILSRWPYWQLALFLGITFLAVYLRRYGPRWFALGFIIFMTYFAPMLFPIPRESALWVIACVFASTAVVIIIRFFLFPDQPQSLLKWYLRSFEVRLEKVLRDLANGFEEISNSPEEDIETIIDKGRLKIRKDLFKVSELSLTIEQFLNSEDSHAFKAKAEALQINLFERELCVRQVLAPCGVLIAENAGPAITQEVANAVQQVLKDIHRARPSTAIEKTLNHLKDLSKSSSLIIQKAIDDFSQALKDVKEETLHPVIVEPVVEKLIIEKEKETVSTSRPQVSPVARKGLQLNTRQAIQATLATGLASVGGMLLSSDRWYWAAITAFVIFAGASRGETLMRAFWRILGTLTGLVVGFVLAYLFSGQPAVEWSIILVCVFVGIFSVRMTFGFWTVTTFTLMISLLFDLTGQLTQEIFLLRLEETILGSLIGAIVSAIVLPISTRSTIRQSLAKLLRTSGDVLGELPLGLNENLSRRNLVRKLREMDQDFFGFRTAAAPITGQISLLRQGEIPALMYDISMLTYFIRHLATYKGPLDGLSLEQIRLFCLKLKSEIRNQAEAFESGTHSETPLNLTPRNELPPTTVGSDIAHLFDRIEQILVSLSQKKL